MLYNNPHAQVLKPAWPAPAADSAMARRGAVSLQGSRYYICSCICCCVPRASRGARSMCWAQWARGAAGSAEWPIARLPPACSARERAAGTSSDSHSHPRLRCLVAAAALRGQCSADTDKEPGWETPAQTSEVSIDIRTVIHEIN